MVFRFTVIISILFCAFGLLIWKVYNLQIVHGDYYTARAESEYSALNALTASRGLVYFTDKDGNQLPAVVNKDFPVIYAVPKDVEDPEEAANALSPILNRPVDELEKLLSKPNDSYELLQKKADQSVAGKIEDLKIKGIYIKTESNRFYPLAAVASHILGYVGPNSENAGESGHYGLEEFYNEVLSGVSGDMFGGKVVEPKQGEDLILTIDPNIQIEAERILANLVGTYKAEGGSVIVEDPKTGKILAMTNLPNFDPNTYSKYPVADFMNSSVQQIYEPGSVFKVFTMATGIDSGKITPETTYYDAGSVTLNGWTISNYDLKTHGPYGRVTMTNVVEHSINTGAVFAERQIGRTIFSNYLGKFGFSEDTGVDLPGEVKGNLSRLSPKERDVAFATASYGQGVAVTPVEIINAASAIANGGNLMRPYLNAALEPQIVRNVISAETAREVTQMMVSAVDRASVAQVAGFSVAGKTGTAFIPDFVHGGYTDRVIDSYIGFAPATSPKFVALIKLNNLPSASLAAQSVVPAFRDLTQFIINYYGLQPDRIQ